MSDIHRLREERARIWAQMKDIMSHAEGRDMNTEELQRYKALEADLDAKTEEVDARERFDGLESRANAAIEPPKDVATITVTTEDDPEKRYARAFGAFLRGGLSKLDPEQRSLVTSTFATADGKESRAQGTGTTAGGYLIPAGFRRELIETQVTFGAVREVATVIDTDSGGTLPWPTVNDTANVGAILAENTQVTEQDVTFGQATLGAYMYTSKLVRVSIQLLDDSGFDVEGFLRRALATRIARIQNQHFTTGTGTAQPEGIQTNATSAVTLATGNTTAVTYAGLVAAIEAIDPAYRNNARWMFKNLSAARSLVDTTGRPIWEPSVQAGAPDMLLGYPVTINPDLPTPAASTKSILFGDFRAGYVIRDVRDLRVLRLEERYADFLQVAFLLFQRSDAKPQDATAYKAITQSAT